MTNREFYALYDRLKKQSSARVILILREVKRIYEEGAAEAAKMLILIASRGLSSLTEDMWAQIKNGLDATAAKIETALTEGLKKNVLQQSNQVLSISESYLQQFIDISAGKLSQFGITNMFIGVDQELVQNMIGRVSESGYSFSQRIWRVGQNYEARIKDIIEVGFALGRDVVDIAQDLAVYVKEGRRGLAKRYGDLKRGSLAWKRRIHKNIDYNALRLARSELYKSLQEASVRSGMMNPGSDKLFDWVRNTHEDWGCICPELEADSPYEADEIPAYPHPNCLCTIRPLLRDRQQFVDDLKAWANGGSVDYLDGWYASVYLKSA